MDQPLPNVADLDPAGPGDIAGIRRLFECARSDQVPGDDFLAEVIARSPCARLRGEARLMLGMMVQIREDPAAAVPHFTRGLRDTWGSGGSIERRAVINFSILCVSQQRPLEAMLLARRGRAISAADEFHAAISDLNLAAALMALGDFQRATELLRAVDEVADRLRGGERRYVDVIRHMYRIAAAYENVSVETARASLQYLESAGETGICSSTMWCFRARVAFAAGEMEDAVCALQHLRSPDEPWTEAIADSLLLEVRAYLRLDQREQALALALTLIERLEAPISDSISPGNRLETARVLAEEIGDRPDSADLARRALAIAATGALERIWQADRFRRDLPGFEFLTGEDRRVIDEYHGRFTSAYGDVLSQMARFLASPEELARSHAADPSEQLICVCAWCQRIRGPEGLWLDVGEFDPPGGSVRMTHGACEPCFEETLAVLAAPV